MVPIDHIFVINCLLINEFNSSCKNFINIMLNMIYISCMDLSVFKSLTKIIKRQCII